MLWFVNDYQKCNLKLVIIIKFLELYILYIFGGGGGYDMYDFGSFVYYLRLKQSVFLFLLLYEYIF